MSNSQPLAIGKYLSPLSTIERSEADNTLGSVLSLVNSSHEAVFIFGDNNKFMGLVSPYKTLYSSNHPYTTKVSSIVFNPPAITKDTPVYEVAEQMLASKIYALPVFNNQGELQNVIHAKDILQAITRDADLLELISSKIHPNTPITAPITSITEDVFQALKEKGVSRMIIIDAQGSLAGIVTRSDLMRSLIKPTSKMRFPSEGTLYGRNSMAGEKTFRMEAPIRKYYTTFVSSLSDSISKKDMITRLIESLHNSIVLLNKYNHPSGFLSTRDILQTIALLRPQEDIPLIMKRPGKSVSDEELMRAIEHLEHFGKKIKKRVKVEKIEVASTETKNVNGDTKVFNITVIVTPVAGKALVAETKKRSFLDGIQEATTLLEKQQRRSGFSKKETRLSAH